MKILGGIDAGGTRTRLALAREDGELIGFAESGCSSFVELGVEKSIEALRALYHKACESAELKLQPLGALFIGSGSILHAEDARTNCRIAVSAGLVAVENVSAENDAWNALAGTLLGRPGILLIAGTGSACLGKNAAGETWRAGGWGHLLDDLGSAYQLGQSAMVAATRAFDGRGETTGLLSVVCEKLQLSDLKQIYQKLHFGGITRAEIASLAPEVVRLAEQGDGVAQNIVATNVRGLVEMIAAVARKLDLGSPEIGLTGGLVTNAALFRGQFLDELSRTLPEYSLSQSGLAPVLGAVILALQAGKKTPTSDSFVNKLRESSARFPQLKLA